MRAYHETYGLDTTVTNCSNNYGPYQFPEKLIPLTLINILQGKPLPVYGDGLQVRDWLHVADHCEAIALALTRGRSGEVYNIGGNSETANIEIVRTLCALVDERLAASAGACGRPFRPRRRSAAKRRSRLDHACQAIGPGTTGAMPSTIARPSGSWDMRRAAILSEGLRETLDWYLANRGWWQALLGRDYAAWMTKNYKHN